MRTLHDLRIRQVLAATPHTRIVRVDLEATFEYQAGQSVMLGTVGGALRKPYSIACAPQEAARRRRLEFLIKVDLSGRAGAHLPELYRGARIDLEGPVGTFRLPNAPHQGNLLFIAGGTGIAPVRAMLWHALLNRWPGPLSVLYSARTPSEFAYAAELRRLARDRRIRLTLTVTRDAGPRWRGDRGRINLHRLAPLVDHDETLCFLCGPPSLLRDVPPLLWELGITAPRIRMEEW